MKKVSLKTPSEILKELNLSKDEEIILRVLYDEHRMHGVPVPCNNCTGEESCFKAYDSIQVMGKTMLVKQCSSFFRYFFNN